MIRIHVLHSRAPGVGRSQRIRIIWHDGQEWATTADEVRRTVSALLRAAERSDVRARLTLAGLPSEGVSQALGAEGTGAEGEFQVSLGRRTGTVRLTRGDARALIASEDARTMGHDWLRVAESAVVDGEAHPLKPEPAAPCVLPSRGDTASRRRGHGSASGIRQGVPGTAATGRHRRADRRADGRAGSEAAVPDRGGPVSPHGAGPFMGRGGSRLRAGRATRVGAGRGYRSALRRAVSPKPARRVLKPRAGRCRTGRGGGGASGCGRCVRPG
jgi:hypothetical protein